MSKERSSGGVGMSGVLFLIFLVLKLTGNIDWSWWWVTSPLWGGFAFAFVIYFLVVVVLGGASLFSGITKRNAWKKMIDKDEVDEMTTEELDDDGPPGPSLTQSEIEALANAFDED